jgi:aryl-alcohol dehydrogenase-like predicted oxidoreductase
LLGGVLKKMESGRRARPAFSRLIEQYRPQLEAYEGLCEDLGETPSDVALAWLLQNPVVTAPLIGPRTVEQLQQALHATTITLSDDTMSCLDELWPGPGEKRHRLMPGNDQINESFLRYREFQFMSKDA